MSTNPRYKNGYLRRKHRQRLKAMQAECGICKGRLGRIHYEEPSDSKHPLSFVIDEIIPISKYQIAGYNSKEEAAQDPSNIQAAHYVCNQMKGNKLNYSLQESECNNKKQYKPIKQDGDW